MINNTSRKPSGYSEIFEYYSIVNLYPAPPPANQNGHGSAGPSKPEPGRGVLCKHLLTYKGILTPYSVFLLLR